MGGILVIYLAAFVLWFVGFYKVFEKAGRPGWEGLIPVYNMYILAVEIAKKEILWFVLLLIPCVNIYAGYVIGKDIAHGFGKEESFAIGLAILPIIFYPILGFGSAQWRGVAPAPPAPPSGV
jgi:hypothetical protein